ncbi:MAG: N-acetylmuramoyl-L-alanine amidase [Flavobacteriales bacterium]|nr:N-acetylmuramoyl-L-alanine amidase [Flavobacteriales bacterium]MBX2959671.1 N-acetylmuramoyl-L-alanine amidase [Flavobacteriales bacterium]
MALKRSFLLFLVFFSSIFLSNQAGVTNDFFGVKTVVIDAGHGGKDGGCVGAIANEKNIALSISLKLGKYIEENFKDVKVIYTRTTDVFLELTERARIANKANADLFICIHVNSGATPTAIGTETYVMGLHKTESNLKVAQRENASILLEDDYESKYENFDPNSPESYIVLTLTQSAHLEQSLMFASKVQKEFTEKVGRYNRGVKQAGFLVLHQTAMPSVLIETGFITNREEEKFLASDIGQDYMASAIYRAFKEYKTEIESKGLKTEDKKIEDQNQKPEVKEVVEEKKNKKDKKPEKEEGVVFKIQIATSSVKTELKPENFNGLEGVTLYEAGGLYRYTYGNEKSMNDANRLQLQLKEKGFKDAFIVAFKDGIRIPISEAIKLQEK